MKRPCGEAAWKGRSPEITWRTLKIPAGSENSGHKPMTPIKWLSLLPIV